MANWDTRSYRSFPFLPSPSSPVTAEPAPGSAQCQGEKQRGTNDHQSAGGGFLPSGLSSPPAPPRALESVAERGSANADTRRCAHPPDSRDTCDWFFVFTRMPASPLDSLSRGQPGSASVGKFQTRCTPLLQSSISFT